MNCMEGRRLRDEIASAVDLSIESIPVPPGPPAGRTLTQDEVRRLEESGSSCPDWSRVRTGKSSDLGGVSGCRFEGGVLLALSPGSVVSGSTVEDCVFSGKVTVRRNLLLRGLRVLDGTTIEDCGRIVFEDASTLARGPRMNLGVETGERRLSGIPAMGVDLAARLSSGDAGEDDMKDYEDARSSFASFIGALNSGIIGPHASIRCAPLVENCLIGESCSLDCPGPVRNSILLGSEGEGCSISDGSVVRSSVVQWSASVDCMAMVEESIVCEAAHVERGARLASSILGPCSEHGSGEVTSSLVGPLCAMHHQSLLIAARWPDGCGNVGYGANIGSNHTSRLPDQEISIGGGVFFGLGSSVKFPAFVAPGTIVATGVLLPPGRIAYPFSLVTQGGDPASGHPCELLPGWVIYANLFSILRNAKKHKSRFRAKRSQPPGCLTSPETALQILRARAALSSIPMEASSYTGSELPGAGPCVVSEEARLKGIEGYTMYLRWTGLSSLLSRLEKGNGFPEPGAFEMNGHLCALAPTEFPGQSPRALMERYLDLTCQMKASVLESRVRDYRRGSSVIPDYAGRHRPPSEDPVLLEVLDDLDNEMRRASIWLGRV